MRDCELKSRSILRKWIHLTKFWTTFVFCYSLRSRLAKFDGLKSVPKQTHPSLRRSLNTLRKFKLSNLDSSTKLSRSQFTSITLPWWNAQVVKAHWFLSQVPKLRTIDLRLAYLLVGDVYYRTTSQCSMRLP